MTLQEQYISALRDYNDPTLPAGYADENLTRLEEELFLTGSSNGIVTSKEEDRALLARAEVFEWADRHQVIPEGERRELAELVTPASEFVMKVKRQAGNSCASNALAGAVEITRNWQGLPYKELNPTSIYSFACGGRDRGSSLSKNMRLAIEKGIAPTNVFSTTNYRVKPKGEAAEEALNYRVTEACVLRNENEFKSALLDGFVIYFGYRGHAINGAKYIDERRFAYLNSWGENWGNNGFGTLRYSSIYWAYGVYAILACNHHGTNLKLAT